MSYSESAAQLINWVENAIDRRKGGCERSKITVAVQTLVLLAGVLRAEHPMFPRDKHSYGVSLTAKELLKKFDPDLDESLDRSINQKQPRGGAYSICGIDGIAANNIFKGLTKAKARTLRSKLNKSNKEEASTFSKNQVVKSWCETLGLPIELIRLNDEDINDLARYLKSMYLDGETVDTDLPQQALTA
jgi:hypothetical protein